MPLRIPSWAASVAHRAPCQVSQGFSRPVRVATFGPRSSGQIRAISRAPPDAWAPFWANLSMKRMTLKEFETIQRMKASEGSLKRSKALEYYECAHAFFVAVENGSSPGTTYLLDHPQFDVVTIYEAGCLLDALGTGLFPLKMGMWASASAMGYQPATITAASDLIRKKQFGQFPFMRKVESDFRLLVNRGKDPNALAAEGMRLYRMENKPSQAMTMFRRALSLGGPEFSYKSKCDSGLGAILHSQGKKKEAQEHLEAAFDADPYGTGLALGDIYQSSDPEKARQVYFRTAVLGQRKAWELLTDLELGMAMDAKDEATKHEHELWAMEFQRLKNSLPTNVVFTR